MPKMIIANFLEEIGFVGAAAFFALQNHRTDIFNILKNDIREGGGGDWFILTLMGLYMISPFLYEICKSKKLEEYFICLCLVAVILFPALGGLPRVGEKMSEIIGSAYFLFPCGCTIYYILGHYLDKYIIPKTKECLINIITGFIVLGGLCIGLYEKYQDVLLFHVVDSPYPYVNIKSMCLSIVISFFIMSKKNIQFKPEIAKLISHFGKNSIVIYVLHFSILRIFQLNGVNPSWGYYTIGVFIETSIIFMLCIAISLILEKIPVVNVIFK